LVEFDIGKNRYETTLANCSIFFHGRRWDKEEEEREEEDGEEVKQQMR